MPNLRSLNYCVYCGTSEGPLNDEHTIPEALKGNRYLGSAACETCRKITNDEFENFCLNETFLSTRVHLGWMPKKARPHLKLGTGTPSKDFRWKKRIAQNEHPLILLLPVFAPPSFIGGIDQGEGFAMLDCWKFISSDAEEKLKSSATSYWQGISPEMFLRMIAKIAHTEGIGQLGENAFDPVLPPIILGTSKNISRFVGGDPQIIGARPPPFVEQVAHQTSSAFYIDPNNKARPFWAVQVHLFLNFNAPAYLAILGPALKSPAEVGL